MPNKKITELIAASALTGVELVEAVQGGTNVKTTTQDIADLASGGTVQTIVAGANISVDDTDPANPIVSSSGGTELDLATPSTAGGTITLDMNSQVQRMFVGSASFGTAKAIALSNDTVALVLNLVVTLSNVAAVLTFPATFTMNSGDTRWNNGAGTFTPAATGKYEFSATWDGTDWNLKVNGPYA